MHIVNVKKKKNPFIFKRIRKEKDENWKKKLSRRILKSLLKIFDTTSFFFFFWHYIKQHILKFFLGLNILKIIILIIEQKCLKHTSLIRKK